MLGFGSLVIATDLSSALIGAGGVVLGATGAAFITLRIATQNNIANERLTKLHLEHDRELAWEERTQLRRGDAYVALVRYITGLLGFAASLIDQDVGDSYREASLDERDQLLAELEAFGSVEVRDQFESLVRRLYGDEFLTAVKVRGLSVPGSDQAIEADRALRSANGNMQLAFTLIREQIRKELQP